MMTLSESQKQNVVAFFSGENTIPILEDGRVILKGALTGRILYTMPYETALKIVEKNQNPVSCDE